MSKVRSSYFLWSYYYYLLFINLAYMVIAAPRTFYDTVSIEVIAGNLASAKSQLLFDYYSLPFCKSERGIEYQAANLGEELSGTRVSNTPYRVEMARNKSCTVLCEVEITAEESQLLAERIRQDYSAQLLIDDLPCVTSKPTWNSNVHRLGYKLGVIKGDKFFLNNHLILHLKYQKDEEFDTSWLPPYRIVGFEVEPQSNKYESASAGISTCSGNRVFSQLNGMMELPANGTTSVLFTYEVVWSRSDILWASRWDIYMASTDSRIHWLSIVNSLVFVLLLLSMLVVIVKRAGVNNVTQYGKTSAKEETVMETRWKLLHGDVFRPPHYPALLSTLVGSGMQILCCTFIVLILASLGVFSPSSPGLLETTIIYLFAVMGAVSGYYSGRLFKALNGERKKCVEFLTAVLYPSLLFGALCMRNLLFQSQHASNALSFGTMSMLLTLWLVICVPLVCAGYYWALSKRAIEHPIRPNQTVRTIPKQPWYFHLVPSTLVGGVLPYGAINVGQIFFLLSIWQSRFYSQYGFLCIFFIIFIITCALSSIFLVYIQLCFEDHRWWWRSFIVSGGSAIYVFAYCTYFFLTKSELSGSLSTLLYCGNLLLATFTLWLVGGTIGFYSAYYFVTKLYACIKDEQCTRACCHHDVFIVPDNGGLLKYPEKVSLQ